MGKKGHRSKAPKSQEERDARRAMVVDLLNRMRPIGDVYRTVCAKFDVTSETVRKDLKWAGSQVAKDLDAAAKADPVKTYHRLDAIEDIAARSGAAAPIIDRDGQPLMGRTEDGEEYPILVADPKLLGVAVKAAQAKMNLAGWRDSIKWKRSLQHQQVKLAKAKTDLAREQLRVAEQAREIEEERRALLNSKTLTRGGIPVLQKPDQEVLNRMSRFLITGKTELEGWLLSHSQDEETEDAQDHEVDGGDGSDGDPADAPGAGADIRGERRERGDPGSNGSGD